MSIVVFLVGIVRIISFLSREHWVCENYFKSRFITRSIDVSQIFCVLSGTSPMNVTFFHVLLGCTAGLAVKCQVVVFWHLVGKNLCLVLECVFACLPAWAGVPRSHTGLGLLSCQRYAQRELSVRVHNSKWRVDPYGRYEIRLTKQGYFGGAILMSNIWRLITKRKQELN